MAQKHTQGQGDLPLGLSQPAQRALAGAGIQSLEGLAKFSQAEIKNLHGIGPNALGSTPACPGRKRPVVC